MSNPINVNAMCLILLSIIDFNNTIITIFKKKNYFFQSKTTGDVLLE